MKEKLNKLNIKIVMAILFKVILSLNLQTSRVTKL